MAKRRLFSEISPLTYEISYHKEVLKRDLQNQFSRRKLAKVDQKTLLPIVLRKHKSLIRRRLGNVDLQLQENKAVSLGIAAAKVDHVIIKPGETFSFWHLVGRPSKRKGYKEGLIISNNKASSGLAGGMCQFTNLIHWMILHSELTIIEHHHHNSLDLFPDYGRQIPFGTGTSIVYNYLDYRFQNNTKRTYQLIIYTTAEYLCGELRSDQVEATKVHIYEEEAYFYEKVGQVFRHNKIYRRVNDKRTGQEIKNELLLENNSRVVYDRKLIDPHLFRNKM